MNKTIRAKELQGGRRTISEVGVVVVIRMLVDKEVIEVNPSYVQSEGRDGEKQRNYVKIETTIRIES